jgi:IS30 family transposase
VHIRSAIAAALEGVPFEVTGMDFDNGSEFINHDLIGWAPERDIYFTRSGPYKKNNQATTRVHAVWDAAEFSDSSFG